MPHPELVWQLEWQRNKFQKCFGLWRVINYTRTGILHSACVGLLDHLAQEKEQQMATTCVGAQFKSHF